ncbi:hypothetical protein HELRODRAFT_180459 [Helobdella robusta]|uniref:MORN repeat-containing protein 5 n=1 Tax=Helobdella robusta TaxID=6412 RepID=T1FFY2_HELRO|nr:hypothetical protein HELRODRAFT_180459 [Helobdella robusta]ESN93808.1 hypothetical protein HELRODRAFT_180459 [Helobdella robusta]
MARETSYCGPTALVLGTTTMTIPTMDSIETVLEAVSENTGQWVKDMKEGVGTLIYSNGDVYRGNWESGKKHGKGLYFFAVEKLLIASEWNYGVRKRESDVVLDKI